ncbi:MAG: hypothetical protein ABL921_08155 [Pirellula sp.]
MIGITSAHDRIDLRKAQLTAFAGEIIASRFSPIDARSGAFQMEIAPKLSGDTTNYIFTDMAASSTCSTKDSS